MSYLSSKISERYKEKVFCLIHAVLCFILIAEYINIPISTTRETVNVSFHYDMIRNDEEDCAVLEMPVSWLWAKGNVELFTVGYMYYPVFHNKRMINGYVSKLPPHVFGYFRDLPLFSVFILRQSGIPPDIELVEEAKYIAEGFVQLTNLKYIVVHRNNLKSLEYRFKEANTHIENYIDDYLNLVRYIFPVADEKLDEEGNVLFILDNTPDLHRNHYRMNDSDIRAYLLKGVHHEIELGFRWITSKSAIFGFPNYGREYSRLRIFGLPYAVEGKTQVIKAFINGRIAYSGTVDEEPSYIDITMAETDFRKPIIYINLEFDYSISAMELGIVDDARPLSYMIGEIVFE